MRILIITDAWHPQINGVVRTYEYLDRELSAMGYTVEIIGPNEFPYTIAMPGYSEIRLTLFPYNRLRRMIEDFKPTVLHIATEGPLGLAARAYAREYGVEFTSCYHTHFPDYAAARMGKFIPFLSAPVRNAAIRYIRWFHALSSCVFVSTGSLENTLKEWNFKVPIKRMTRGIEERLFFPGEKTSFQAYKPPIALYVGRIAVEKNLEAFLQIKWPGTKIIVGDGPDREKLTQAYPDAIFTGVRKNNDLASCYRAADVFVFPSKTDTFGMVMLEALACGTPVAAFPVPGPMDIVTDPMLGALNDDLSEAVTAALNAPGTREQRAAFVKSHYSWPLAARQFLETD